MFVILLPLIILVITLSFFYYKNFGYDQTTKEFLKNFFMPPAKFLLGHIPDFGSSTKVLPVLDKYFNTYGRTVKVLVGPFYTALLTSEYELFEFLLTSTKILKKSLNYTWLEPWLGNGLLVADGGSRWVKNRKILTPAFHFGILKEFVETFESGGNVLVEILKKRCNGKNFDVYPLCTLCTLDIICETAMGVKINAQTSANSDYVHSVEKTCRIFIDRTFNVLGQFNFTFALTKDFYIQKKSIGNLHSFTRRVIKQKVEELDKKGLVGCKDDSGIKKKLAFLDLLLEYSQNGKLMSYDEIQQEVDTFMFAGHHTTGAAISFTLFSLANNPEVQQKAFEEQKNLFGDDKNPTITHKALQEMNYLELVIKESLRLYPPVPLLGRITTEEVPFGNLVFPKDLNISMSIYSMHRDPKYWKDPEMFYPERFLDFDGTEPFSYVPFSAGPRNCIGQKFAMLEMKSVLSKILRHFKLLPTDPPHSLELAVEAVLTSINGVKIRLAEKS